MASSNEFVTVLVCVECKTQSDDGRGWRAEIVNDDAVGNYCPECWQYEFGGLT